MIHSTTMVIQRRVNATVESETPAQRGSIPRDQACALFPDREAAHALRVEEICAPHKFEEVNAKE